MLYSTKQVLKGMIELNWNVEDNRIFRVFVNCVCVRARQNEMVTTQYRAI